METMTTRKLVLRTLVQGDNDHDYDDYANCDFYLFELNITSECKSKT